MPCSNRAMLVLTHEHTIEPSGGRSREQAWRC
jgi:hypothetical protein